MFLWYIKYIVLSISVFTISAICNVISPVKCILYFYISIFPAQYGSFCLLLLLLLLYHIYVGYLQFYTWNKPCFWGI